MTDALGRPYFLWDCDMSLATFEERLRDPDPEMRAHFLAKLLRQARPDDAISMVGTRAIRAAWPSIENQLGDKHDLWSWWLRVTDGHVADPAR